MAANPNTNIFKQTWEDVYQITHHKMPAYKALADETKTAKLKKGQILHRDYDSDFLVNTMGADGGYTDQAWVDTDETLTVNFEKETSFFIKDLDEFQANLPLQKRKAMKAMNAIFLKIDADVLNVAYQGAASILDDGAIGGTAGQGISLNVANIQTAFSTAELAMRLQNVIVDPAARFDGSFKRDAMPTEPRAVISPHVYAIVQQYLGGKVSELGDKVTRNGYVGFFLGFNLFVSNNLAWSGNLTIAANPTAGDTITLFNTTQKIKGVNQTQTLTITFVSSLTGGSTTNAQVLIGGSVAATNANLVALIASPYTNVGGQFNGWLQASQTLSQQKVLFSMSATYIDASGNVSGSATNFIRLIVAGQGNMPATATFTSGSNFWQTGTLVQHNIVGTNNAVTVVVQKTPNLEILQANPVAGSGNSGRIGKDFVTWTAYGIKVFQDQTQHLVDFQVRTDTFTQVPINDF